MYIASTELPWAFKILYGVFCDTIPIFGSTKRSYIVLSNLLVLVTYGAVVLFPEMSALSVTWMTILAAFGLALSETVVMGIMVIVQRKDPKCGSEDLNTFEWIVYGATSTIVVLI